MPIVRYYRVTATARLGRTCFPWNFEHDFLDDTTDNIHQDEHYTTDEAKARAAIARLQAETDNYWKNPRLHKIDKEIKH